MEAEDRADRLERELKGLKSQQPTNKDDDEKIKALENEKQGLQEKNENLEEKAKGLTKQLLDIKRPELYKRITSLNSNLNISAGDLRKKFGGDYSKILNEELTLENIGLLEQTLRVLAGICSIEKSKKISDVLEKQERPTAAAIRSLQGNLERNKENWEEVSDNISQENNPLYQPIIGEQNVYRKLNEELINKWKDKRSKRSIIDLRGGGVESWDITKTRKYQELIRDKTIFGVSKKDRSRVGIEDYFGWLKEKYPTLADKID